MDEVAYLGEELEVAPLLPCKRIPLEVGDHFVPQVVYRPYLELVGSVASAEAYSAAAEELAQFLDEFQVSLGEGDGKRRSRFYSDFESAPPVEGDAEASFALHKTRHVPWVEHLHRPFFGRFSVVASPVGALGEGRRFPRVSRGSPFGSVSTGSSRSGAAGDFPRGCPLSHPQTTGGFPRYKPALHYPSRGSGASLCLPDKEFRYLRTVIVTAAVYRGFGSELRRTRRLTPPLNLPALGRRQSLYFPLGVSRDLCF